MKKFVIKSVTFAASMVAMGAAQAYTFETENIRGNFDSTVSYGTGIRAKNPDTSMGNVSPFTGYDNTGNANYQKGDRFANQLKGSHDLLLKLPEDVTFMGRANWVRDYSATHIHNSDPGVSLSDDAAKQMRYKGRILDLWVGKGFDIGDERARIRVGNQVINWGESLFLPGGINATNSMDIMRLSQPGTQLKEAVLPAPMVSFATGLGHGFNLETYVQYGWNQNYFPPVGSYWSTSSAVGPGAAGLGAAGLGPLNSETKARNSGQWGTSLRYQPEGTQLNLGAYVINYHDKSPVMLDTGVGTLDARYLEDRKLYGVSVNFPVGDWAIGSELSYRPKDAVSVGTPVDGKYYVDSKKYQWAVTGLLSLTPSGTGSGVLKFLGADTGTFLGEAVVVKYPNLQQDYNGSPVAAGAWTWGAVGTDPAAAFANLFPRGTKTSSGFNFDFSVAYDGTIIPGWQVVPEIYYFKAQSGYTPNASGLFMQGAQSVNYIVSFIQNPATWQVAVNYAKFWGGKEALDQPLRGRDFYGLVASRNF
jgi:Protein of unknown function (DUF1302)